MTCIDVHLHVSVVALSKFKVMFIHLSLSVSLSCYLSIWCLCVCALIVLTISIVHHTRLWDSDGTRCKVVGVNSQLNFTSTRSSSVAGLTEWFHSQQGMACAPCGLSCEANSSSPCVRHPQYAPPKYCLRNEPYNLRFFYQNGWTGSQSSSNQLVNWIRQLTWVHSLISLLSRPSRTALDTREDFVTLCHVTRSWISEICTGTFPPLLLTAA